MTRQEKFIEKVIASAGTVYSWEDKEVIEKLKLEYLTLKECSKIANSIRKDFGLKRVKVGDGRGAPWGRADHSTGIQLPKLTRTKPYVVHETAHTLCTELYDHWYHGPTFVSVYIFLANKYLGMGKRRLYKTARKAGILDERTRTRRKTR